MFHYKINWKDFNSPLFRNEIWVGYIYLWPKLFGLPFTPFGILSQKNNISYFTDMKVMRKLQHVLMERIEDDPEYLEDLIELAERWGRQMNRYTEKVYRADLKHWSPDRLEATYLRFTELQRKEYAVGVLLVMLDTSAGPQSIDHLVRNILAERLKGKHLDRAYAAFTTPLVESFSREQEKDLLKIYSECWRITKVRRALKEDVEHLPQVLQTVSPRILSALEKHTAKWAWVYYVYAGPPWQERDFAQILHDWARRGVNPAALLQQWNKEKKEVRATRQRYLKILRLDRKKEKLLELISLVVWAKPHRKDYQSKSFWHMEKLQKEAARRLNISLREVRSMPMKMLFESLRSGKVDIKKLHEFEEYHVIAPGDKKEILLSGARAQKYMEGVKEDKVKVHGRVFTGSPACSGRASGTVRIVNSPEEMEKMQEGDILVSVATTPSIVPAMRRAAAILTDEGGLTCHAAIVSRELGIPCVVGLSVVTSAFKDGDRVEVDATKGVVRKI